MKAKLPYSQSSFGVPNNVYIIGTMNTADRSIATIDTTLRRRFSFKEMMPDAEVLEGIYVEDISVREMLERMNKRISVLYDREHTLGHAYFVPLKADMYQMYAYQKKYGAVNVTLIYPMTDKVKDMNIKYQSEDGVMVKHMFC